MTWLSPNDIPPGNELDTEPALGLLVGLQPPVAELSELFADPPSVRLYPEEAELIGNAVEQRRREFATVRWCARTALARLGVARGPILHQARRAPVWPDGIVGSMTHCDGYRAAAVARRSSVTAIGVDAEPNLTLPDGVENAVLLPEERADVVRLAAWRPDIAWDRLIFSAKESVFKAWFPLTGRWLDFEECVITFGETTGNTGTFVGTFTVPGAFVAGREIGSFAGRWRARGEIGNGHVGTLVTVDSPARPRSV
ncbi:4'-phosphopantetheinyl transferase [Streptomyces bacillaris]|uniref:4'-phosphopantetheinyl transferase family protein n=1 Tax=Streptomyces bacillaris TaxID=68179 RepID=UPI0035D878F3